ncbi:hypothetical protein OKA06_20000 [Novosphingobium sp. MW5]|nr:hypothetical protein [Novosphingobium sp. MW5]
MAFQLGLALTIAYLRFNGKGEETSKVGWTDMAIAVTAFLVLMYAALDFSWLLKEQSYRPWQITVIGTVVTIAVMEGIRRKGRLDALFYRRGVPGVCALCRQGSRAIDRQGT